MRTVCCRENCFRASSKKFMTQRKRNAQEMCQTVIKSITMNASRLLDKS